MLISRSRQRSTNAVAEQAHEAGEADELDAGALQRRVERRVECLARRR